MIVARKFCSFSLLIWGLLSCSSTNSTRLPAISNPIPAVILGFANQVEEPRFKDPKLALALDAELADLVWNSHYFSLKELNPELAKQRKQAQAIAWATGNTALQDLAIQDSESIAHIWASLVFIGRPMEEMSIGVVHRRTEGTLIRVQICADLPNASLPYCAYGDGESETVSTSILLRITNEDRLDASQSDGPKALRMALQNAWDQLLPIK